MKLQRHERIVEVKTLYVIATIFEDCTVVDALQFLTDNRQMQSDKLLEVQVQKINNKVLIVEVFKKIKKAIH